MASVSWIHAGSGNWTTATDWSTGAVPGSGDDVSIVAAGAITVTVSAGNNLVDSLTTGANDALALTGGTLDILGYGSLSGSVKQSVAASRLIVSGQGITVYGNFTQTAGTVIVQAGKFVLDGAANSLAGSVSGAGWLTLDNTGSASTTTLATGAALTVAHVNVQYATLSLAANISYAGNYVQTGTLLLNAKSLTLTGVASIAGSVGTNGALDLNGAETLDGATINGSTAINISATTTLRGATLTLGGAAGATANIDVLAGGTLRIADDSGIATGSTSSKIQVSGTLLKSGYAGESVIASQVFNYSTVVPVGTITVAGGTLGLQGTHNGIGGLVNGAGTLAFDGAATVATIYGGTTLNVGGVLQSAGSVSLVASLGYAGSWVQTGGTLTVGKTDVLALTGTAQLQAGDIFGPGTITATSVQLGSAYALAIDSGMHLNLSGNSVQTGYVYIGDLANAAPTVTVLAGASYTLQSGDNLEGGPGNGTFAVVGSLISQGPAANYVYVNTVVTGTVTVASGILDLAGVASLGGSIGGAGILSAFGTTTIAAGTTLSVGEIYVGGTLNVLGNESYAGTLVMGNSAVLSVVAGATLTLSGPSYLNGYNEYVTGGGVVASTGSLTVSGISGYPTYLDGDTTLSVANVADQSGDLYVGLSAGANSLVDVLSGATWSDHGGNIYAGSGAGTFENTGTFAYDGAGTAAFTANLDNTSVVQILSGDLGISGTVTGGGSFEIGNGATLGVITAFDPTATVGFQGAAAELQVFGYGTIATGLSNFATGNEIDLVNFSYASVAGLSLAGGVLTATDGSNVAHFTVGAGHTLAQYAQQTDGSGGIAIFHT